MVSSSPNLTVPLSQGTASVLKFRCLYTHDLRRKAKRWQDGFVRYHTFNKRVMVFDDQGNFVGDLHWRKDEVIQDGDELELDKGVLIQVGESMEKRETDLSPLFERNKASQTLPSQSQPRNVPTRSSTPSSQSSRSLNDLLGIKRTPIERLKSPYEHRHPPPPRPAEPDASRHAKRQRTVPSTEKEVPQTRPPVIDLSEPSSVHERAARQPATKPTQPEPIAQPRRRKILGETYPPQMAPTRPVAPIPTTTSHDTRAKPGQSQNKSDNAQPSTHSFPSNLSSSTPKNTLQLSREKPRKKLMYRALLPNQNASETESSDRISTQAEPGHSQDALEPVAPIQVSTDVQMDPGDSTLNVLAEMIDSSSPFESDHEAQVTDDTHTAEKGSTSHNAKPAPTPTPPLKNNPSQSNPVNIPPAAVNHAARSQGIPPAPTKPSSRGFQKSYSDPSAFHAANRIQSRQLPSNLLNPVAEEGTSNEQPNQIQEQGPWTVEALDLFDFWPPGRPKPD